MWNSRVERAVGLVRLGEHLLQRVAVGAVLLGQPGVGAEHARLAEDADVGGVDVLVGGEHHAVAVQRAVTCVSEGSEPEQIGRAEKGQPVVRGEPRALLHLIGDGQQRAIGDAVAIDDEVGVGWHGLIPPNCERRA